MKITFVALGWEQLGVSLLSAIAKERGHEVNLAFSVSLFNDRYNFSLPHIAPLFDDRDETIEAIKQQKPDVLAFSALTGTYQWMLGIAQEAKAIFPHVKIIFGGVHVSAVPDRVLAQAQVDYVCVGEGDIAFVKILEQIEHDQYGEVISNTRYKLPNGEIIRGPQNGFIQDLDALPFYDKMLWEDYINIGDQYFTMASRGCPYRCTFCFNNFFAKLPEGRSGKYIRQRSVEHMMAELRWAKNRYKLRLIEFEDDVFSVDKKWLKRFLDEYKRHIKVPFQCLTHPKYVDEDISRWLAEADCVGVQMGIQTMDDEYKFRTIKRYERSEQVEEALRVMKRHKLRVKVDHMFGLPGEPLEAQEKARALYGKYPPYRIQTFWTNFLPGTEMVHQAFELGLISLEEIERLNDGLEFDFYRNSSKIDDPRKMSVYKAYELIYKLIPVLPKTIAKRLNPRIMAKIPVPVCSWLTFMIDLTAGLVMRNPDHLNYAKHNLFHIFRFMFKKLGLRVPAATRPTVKKPFNSYYRHREKKETRELKNVH